MSLLRFQLVQTHNKKSCALQFEEHEFVEFFGIVSPLDEEDCSFSYELERDGLRLLFTVFPIDGSVYTSVYRDGITKPIITNRLQDCTHARFVMRGAHQCLEIGQPERHTSEPTVPLAWGGCDFFSIHISG